MRIHSTRIRDEMVDEYDIMKMRLHANVTNQRSQQNSGNVAHIRFFRSSFDPVIRKYNAKVQQKPPMLPGIMRPLQSKGQAPSIKRSKGPSSPSLTDITPFPMRPLSAETDLSTGAPRQQLQLSPLSPFQTIPFNPSPPILFDFIPI